jgi:hypothetical protein
MKAAAALEHIDNRYPGLWKKLDEVVTAESYFHVFKQLSDNYSPTLTVSRVQGPLVASLLDGAVGSAGPVKIESNLMGSGTIGIGIGDEAAPVWLSGHGDICSYLTGSWDGSGYELTPFCMHRASAGRRSAAALATPTGQGRLAHLAYGEMVTDEDGRITFETDVSDLPRWTRVVHHLPASWNQESDEFHGFIDNQGTCAALILAARVLSHFDVNVLLLMNDEEEGPVDMGNQGFSRAMQRLLNRTPTNQLPELVIVSDMHQQESRLKAGESTLFGKGALYAGAASGARGAVTPPQLVSFTRDLAAELSSYDIQLTENDGYVSRSDDVSAMQYTQNINLIGFPGSYPHFDQTPTARCTDLVQLTRTLIVYALIAQEETWRNLYL